MDDLEIISLLQSRNENALNEIRKSYGALCMNIAYNILNSREDAEECINDALLSVWQAIPPAEPRSFGAYFITAVRNASFNRLTYLQAERRGSGQLAVAMDELAECIPDSGNLVEMADRIALKDALQRFLAELKQTDRVIFINRYWLCLSSKEIAAEIGFTVAHVNMSLMRTRRKLKAFLEKEELL